ncbi:MAG: hypothetical protein KatS3mg097_345 [Candidatus Parcubacteria bacterium]|nr:MAG: hypothetical protein KatS3mg097_345 [Candidatus Parcubacteria bacterium]
MELFFLFFLSFFLSSIWFWLIFEEDKHHADPIYWLLYAVFLGILAAFLSLFVLKFILGNFLQISASDLSSISDFNFFNDFQSLKLVIIVLLISAFVEEFFKFFTIWFLFSRYKNFEEPADAMIYLSASGFGFAIIETFLKLLEAIFDSSLSSSQLVAAPLINIWSLGLFIVFLRFLGANLLHVIASSMIGYGFAVYRITRRFYPFFIAFFNASLLHFIFNFVIIIGGNILFALPLLWAPLFVVISKVRRLDFFYDKRLLQSTN